jgi:hypothetical protein
MGDTKTTTEQEHDDFGDAFAKLSENLQQPGATVASAAAAAPAPAATDPPKVEPAKVDPPVGTEPAKVDPPVVAAATPAAGAEPAKVDPPATAAAPAPAASTEPDLSAQLAEANRKIAELSAAASTPAPKAEEAPKEKPLYSTDEEALVKAYRENWGDVARGEELVRRGEYTSLVNHIFSEFQRVYGPMLAHVEARAPRDQYTDLKMLVPDYDTVRDPTIAWVKTQPALIRREYERVVSEGSPEEVRDLIEIFKGATGKATAPAAATTPAVAASGMTAAATPAAPADPKTSAAVLALKPVDTKRTEMGNSADPNDFAGAFGEFAAVAR